MSTQMTTSTKLRSDSRRTTAGIPSSAAPRFRFERPSKEMILDPNVAELTRKLASGKVRTSEIENILKRITSRPGFTPGILDRVEDLVLRRQPSGQSLVALLLNSLYVPVDDVGSEFVLPDHVYGFSGTTVGPPSFGSASEKTGVMISVAIMNGQNV